MKKIEVGMMVRSDRWGIGIISVINSRQQVVYAKYNTDSLPIAHRMESDTTQSATHDLIELIQVGDYVNGELVVETVYASDEITKRLVSLSGACFWEEDIESVLTKEQYEANCFHVKGENK